MTTPSTASPDDDETWCSVRRAEVAAHVQSLGLAAGRVGDGPAWHVAPYASLWAVESAHRPEWVGWWVICGDLPTDAITAQSVETPRDAMRAFGKRWQAHADSLDRGEAPAAWASLEADRLPKFGALLRRRGAALLTWADDDAAWPEDTHDDETAG